MSKQMKPYRLDDRKAVKPTLSSVDIAQWRETILANIQAEAAWLPLVTLKWSKKKVANRGFVGDDAAGQAVKLDKMLTFIATYAPSTTFNEITTRCTDLAEVWNIIRRWAGVRPTGSKLLTYYQLRNAYDPSGTQTPQEFYFQLRDAKEECLVTVTSGIKFNGEVLTEDEELTVCIESDIVLDWIAAIGGGALVEHVFRSFSKELETTSLADLQERISDNLPTLLSEAEETPQGQAGIQKTFMKPNYKQRGARPPTRNDRPPRQGNTFPRSPSRPNQSKGFIPCSLCKAKGRVDSRGRPQWDKHSIANCFLLSLEERKAIIKATGVQSADTDDEEEEYTYENAGDRETDQDESSDA